MRLHQPREWAILAAVWAALAIVVAVWSVLDRHPPEWDYANHLERAVLCGRDLSRGDVAGVLAVATATLVVNFVAPLPDDRFTVTVDDTIIDPACNNLDGESNAAQPLEIPTFPSGDRQPGGDFVARFTVDSRPEIGTVCCGSVFVDLNGNFLFDPQGEDNDQVNRDIVFQFGLSTDQVFAGNFAPAGAVSANGFDKLAAYGLDRARQQRGQQDHRRHEPEERRVGDGQARAADAERDYKRIVIEYPASRRSESALVALAQLELARGAPMAMSALEVTG